MLNFFSALQKSEKENFVHKISSWKLHSVAITTISIREPFIFKLTSGKKSHTVITL